MRRSEICAIPCVKPRSRERARILHIHLGNRGHDSRAFDLRVLVKASKGFSGAEIEQGVVSAMFSANADGSPLATDQLLAEFERTRPLSVVMREKIDALRHWAAERTVPAD